MTRTGRTLNEYMGMGAAGKVALLSFLAYLPPDSALVRAMDPKNETLEWYSRIKTNAILADLYDIYVAAHTPKGKRPIYYPRPKEKKSIGKEAIPIKDFWGWWNKER